MVNVPFTLDFSENGCGKYTPGSLGFVTEEVISQYSELKVPEVNSGFTPVWWYSGAPLTVLKQGPDGVHTAPGEAAIGGDLICRALPLWFKADVGPGRYKITATLTAARDSDEITVFVSRRRLAWKGSLRAGESAEIEVLCDVSPIIAVGGGDAAVSDNGVAEDVSVDFTVLGAGLKRISVEPWEGPAMFIMGDSTVTDQPAAYPYAPGCNYCGWGQMLQLYLGTGYVVSNHAHSGLSTETFRDKGHYAVMLPQVKPGDVVLIQFGHNDQKKRRLAAETGYTENLIRYIRELREAGAKPVLVTSLARNTWKSPTEYNDLLERWAAAAVKVGQVENVPVLDLHGMMMRKIIDSGMEGAKRFYHPGDYAHPNDFGAHMAAGFVASELARAGIIPEPHVPAWEIHGPMEGLKRPENEADLHGNAAPAEEPRLVDYGLIPDMPWPVD